MQGERTASWLDDIDPAFGHWLAGFVDGEGCFTINYYKRSDSCAATFSIALRDDDAEILHAIHRTLGFGVVYQNRARVASASQPQVRWAVHRKADAVKLVALFDRYPLRAKKKRDYAVWRRAALEWQGVTHSVYAKHTGDQHALMKALRRELMNGRQYEPTPEVIAVPLLPGRLFE